MEEVAINIPIEENGTSTSKSKSKQRSISKTISRSSITTVKEIRQAGLMEEVAINIPIEENGTSTSKSKSKQRSISKTISRSCIPTVKRPLNPHGNLVLIWTGIFYLSSVIAVSTDPLFLYIPIIKDHKCLGVDKKMMNVTLVLRSITDFIYILHIVFRILQVLDAEDFQNRSNHNKRGNIPKDKGRRLTHEISHDYEISQNGLSSRLKTVFDIIIDILAVLPLPQVIILCFLSKMTSSKYSWDKANARTFLSIFVFLQYAPRSFRILILYNQLKWHVANRVFTVWVQSILYILLYLTASHVGGCFYHLLSIQRETTCWYEACQKHKDGCINLSVFECGYEHRTNMSSNDLTTFVNSFCYDKDSKAFDFGVFGDAVKSNILGSTDIPVKFIETLWWGLRHLSTFGQNLDPTTGTILEVGFVACVCIFGLILFLFLIGTVQTFMQLEATKSEDIRRKMTLKEREVELWIKKHFLLDETIKETIMQKIQSDLTGLRKELDVEDVVESLPPINKMRIKRQLLYSTLKRVPLLRNIREEKKQVLQDFMDKSELVNYNENNYIVREGEPLDFMLFVTQGIVWTFDQTKYSSIDGGIRDDSKSIIRTNSLVKDEFYGEELLEWTVRKFREGFGVPISTTSVKTHTKVEALVLMYVDMRSIVEKHWETVFSKLSLLPS